MKPRFGTTIMVLAIAVGVMASHVSVSSAKDSGAKAAAQPKVSKGKKAAAPQAVPAGVTLNACGCYRSEAGACFCGDKHGSCSCPGDCEPMGCEQKRAKELQREIAVETKKAQDEERKRQADEAAAQAAAEAAARADAGPPTTDDSVSDDADESAEKKADEPKPDKRPTKGRRRAVAKP